MNGVVLRIVHPFSKQLKERVFDFLAGLNKELDEVLDRILDRKPLPSTREDFAEVRMEESRRQVMLGPETHEPSPSIEKTSALMTTKPDAFTSRYPRKSNRVRPICDHYYKLGHIKANAGNYMVNQQTSSPQIAINVTAMTCKLLLKNLVLINPFSTPTMDLSSSC